MKNVTLSADDDLIERARTIARTRQSTLNQEFRKWLAQFAASEGGAQSFDAMMDDMRIVDAGRRFTRDEMNER